VLLNDNAWCVSHPCTGLASPFCRCQTTRYEPCVRGERVHGQCGSSSGEQAIGLSSVSPLNGSSRHLGTCWYCHVLIVVASVMCAQDEYDQRSHGFGYHSSDGKSPLVSTTSVLLRGPPNAEAPKKTQVNPVAPLPGGLRRVLKIPICLRY
jgi:hypothetical protein